MAQTDSSHLHNPYRYASDIQGEESSCGLKGTGATILKLILTSSYFDGPYHLVFECSTTQIYLKLKTPLNKENIAK